MKLCSGRLYKNDLSDIVGVLKEHKDKDAEITFEMIDKAIIKLYKSWDRIPNDSIKTLQEILSDYEKVDDYYEITRQQEKQAKETLVTFDKKYSGVVKQENVNEMIRKIQNK